MTSCNEEIDSQDAKTYQHQSVIIHLAVRLFSALSALSELTSAAITVSAPHTTMRVSKRVLNLASHPVTFRKQVSPLLYSLGLSYAAKHSPPFVAPNSMPGTLGFGARDGPEAQTKIAKWVDAMRALPAGRGELKPTEGDEGDGGWDEELQARVRKWGAGEDFFAIVDAGNFVSAIVLGGCRRWGE